MATVKIIPIRADLNACIDYAVNAEKTEAFGHLGASLGYIADGEKTAEARYVSALGCNAGTAFRQMETTRLRYGKQNAKRQGYHVIQSFEPGEISDPALAHQIGREFAAKVFPGYEAVVATHIDKNHIHNHIVFNSVSKQTGKMYQNSLGYLDDVIRPTSDGLCRKYGLSAVIRGKHGQKSQIEYTDPTTGERVTREADGFSRNRSAWNAEKSGRVTVRGKVRSDIDEIIKRSRSWGDFVTLLQRNGYKVRTSQGGLKHFAITPPNGSRAIRLDSLGDGYSEAEIRARIEQTVLTASHGNIYTAEAMRSGKIPLPPMNTQHTVKRAALRGKLPKKKLQGFQALYYRYLYLMGKVPAQRKKPVRSELRASRYLSGGVKKLNRIMEQHKFLRSNKITDISALRMYSGAVSDEIYRLKAERSRVKKLAALAGKWELGSEKEIDTFLFAAKDDAARLADERQILYAARKTADAPDAVNAAIRKLSSDLKMRSAQISVCEELIENLKGSGTAIDVQIEKINAELKARSAELALCERVESDSGEIEKKLYEAEEFAADATERSAPDKQEKKKGVILGSS